MDNKTIILNYIESIGLKPKMEERKIKIEEIMDYVYDQAEKLKDGNCAMVEDKVVYGWVVHYIEDEYKVVQEKNANIEAETKAAEEKQKKDKKEFEKRVRKEKKEADKRITQLDKPKSKEDQTGPKEETSPVPSEEKPVEEPKKEEFHQMTLFESLNLDIEKEGKKDGQK